MSGAETILHAYRECGNHPVPLVWLADRLLDLAAELPAVHFARVLPNAENPGAPPTFEIGDGRSTLRTTERQVASTFRSLLPRFAVLAAEEMALDPPPLYGGRVVITRNVGGRSVRLDVDFGNTLGDQRLHITRAPVEAPDVNGTPNAAKPTAPTAG
jgi:hypothetical protein